MEVKLKTRNSSNSSFVDKYDKIVNRSISEIEYIRNTYKWYVGIASSIIIIVIGAAYFLISDNINGYEDIINKKFSSILESTREKQDSLNSKFVSETEKNIKSIIAQNFNDKKIRKTIELVATEKVDSISNQYLNELVEQKITPKLNSILSDLDIADAKIQFMDFYLSKVAAYNDDRIAFEKLIAIAQDKTNNYSTESGQIVQSILNKYSQSAVPPKHFFLVSTEKDEDFPWSFSDCKNRIFDYPKDERKIILGNVFEIKRFTDNEKIELVLLVIKKDESLLVVREASNYLIKKFNLPFKSLEIKKIVSSMSAKGFN